MAASDIEWTDETWNPVTGCTRVSTGCDNCYAVTMTRRLAAMGQAKYVGLVLPGKGHFNGVVLTHEEVLDAPLGWRKPRRVFVNSMSDLFHPGVPVDFVRRVFGVMAEANRHVFQVLTKRPERVVEMADVLPWPPNVLLGTSVEDAAVVGRVDALRQAPAYIRFLSCEPLLGPLDALDLSGIDWVIVGGESGPKARPVDPQWVRDLRDRSKEAGAAFHFKQWGRYNEEGQAVGKKKAGRSVDGRTWDEQPPVPGFIDPNAVGYPKSPAPLTDDEWERVEPLCPGRQGTAGGTARDNRAFVDAARWKAWTGRPWRDLPTRFGAWNTAAVRTSRWRTSGHWHPIATAIPDPRLYSP